MGCPPISHFWSDSCNAYNVLLNNQFLSIFIVRPYSSFYQACALCYWTSCTTLSPTLPLQISTLPLHRSISSNVILSMHLLHLDCRYPYPNYHEGPTLLSLSQLEGLHSDSSHCPVHFLNLMSFL